MTSASNTPISPYSDEDIVAWVRDHYSPEMAAQVLAAIRSTDNFGKHVRRSFVREMQEDGV